jgi:hypothetical protein
MDHAGCVGVFLTPRTFGCGGHEFTEEVGGIRRCSQRRGGLLLTSAPSIVRTLAFPPLVGGGGVASDAAVLLKVLSEILCAGVFVQVYPAPAPALLIVLSESFLDFTRKQCFSTV